MFYLDCVVDEAAIISWSICRSLLKNEIENEEEADLD